MATDTRGTMSFRRLNSLHRFSIRHPVGVLIAGAILTLAVAPGVLRLRLRTDGHALVPANAPEILYDRLIRKTHGIDDPIVVMIRTDHPDGIFNRSTLELVNELSTEFEHLAGVRPASIFSLATEHNYRVRTGTLQYQTFLERMPTNRPELRQLRYDIKKIQLYDGTLVSKDEKGTAILVGAATDVDRVALYGRIRDIVDRKADRPEHIHVIGAPVAEALLGTHILDDLGVPESLLGAKLPRPETTSTSEVGGIAKLRNTVARTIGLVPVAIAVMAIVFLISFRSVVATALPLMEVGACLVFVFGMMGWCNVPVYLTIAVLPVILTAIGVADEIHIFHRYADLLRENPSAPHRETLATTMTDMTPPVVKTSITTIVGFLSFTLSPLGPVRAFGIFTAVGVLFCMLWSLTVIPASLALIAPGRLSSRKSTRANRTPIARPSLSGHVAVWLRRARFPIVIAAVAIVVASVGGIRRLVVQDSWIDGFDSGSEFYQATHLFNEQFLGSHILLVTVDATTPTISGEVDASLMDYHALTVPGDLTDNPAALAGRWITVRLVSQDGGVPQPNPMRVSDKWSSWIDSARRDDGHIIITTPKPSGSPKFAMRPADTDRVRFEITAKSFMMPTVLSRIEKLESFLQNHPSEIIGGAHGPAEYLATSNFMVHPSDPASRVIPKTPDRIRWLWQQYERIRGTERMRQVVDKTFQRALITVFMKDANFQDVRKVMSDIRAYEREHLTPYGIKLGFAGDVAVSQALIRGIVSTQVESVLLSVLGILAITAWFARSIGWGFYCVLPCAFAVLVNFAFMGWTHTPLGVATSMFAGMTLGIGVDFAIHFVERFRTASADGCSTDLALAHAMSSAGPAILINAVGVALGFAVMILSQVPANSRLGALVVVSIVNCLIATLLLTPALLSIWSPRVSIPTNRPSGATPATPSDGG